MFYVSCAGREEEEDSCVGSTYLSVERREEEEEGPVSGAQPAGG